jgi:hypothetical protein
VKALEATHDDKGLVETLATFDLPDELTPHGSAHGSAERLARELTGLDWDMVVAARSRENAEFATALASLQEAARLDESVTPLEPRLRDVAAKAREIVVGEPPSTPPTSGKPVPPAHTRKAAVADLDTVLQQLHAEIEAEAGATGTVTITWQVDES